MRQTKGAIGNLLNRYKAVLKKCNLLNTFGSLAVASMLVMGGAGVAQAYITEGGLAAADTTYSDQYDGTDEAPNTDATKAGALTINYPTADVTIGSSASFSNFTNNASTAGGAIKALNGFTIEGGAQFKNNIANAQNGGAAWGGGAIYIKLENNGTYSDSQNVSIGSAEGAKVVFDGNVANSENTGTVQGTGRGGVGGAIAIEYAENVQITNAEFTNNQGNYGGAIAAWRDADRTDDKITTLTISGSTFEGNIAKTYGGAVAGLAGGWGGSEKNTDTYISQNNTYTNNYAKYAGAFWNQGVASFDGDTFTGNGTLEGEEGITNIAGGAIYNASNASLSVSNSTFDGNISQKGGAINNFGGTITEISNSTFSYNISTNSMGGAISNQLGQYEDQSGTKYQGTGRIESISGTTFEGNTAHNGGAIFNGESANIRSISDTVFKGNSAINEPQATAAYHGGAITNAGTIESINNSQFTDNVTSGDGGAIANIGSEGHEARIALNNVTITDNKAGENGGGVYNAANSTLTLEGTNDITDNTSGPEENQKADDLHNAGDVTVASGTTTVDALTNTETGTITVGGEGSVATLAVNRSWTGTGSMTVNNLGTLEVESSIVLTEEGVSNAHNALVNAGGTYRIDGLGDISVKQLEYLKGLLSEGSAGLLDIGTASVEFETTHNGHVKYADVDKITSDQLKTTTVDVTYSEAADVQGGFGAVHIFDESGATATDTVVTNGTLQLAGSENGGYLVSHGAVGEESLGHLRIGKINGTTEAVVTLGREGYDNKGELGNITMSAGTGDRTLNVIGNGNAEFTVAEIYGGTGANKTINVEGATLHTGNISPLVADGAGVDFEAINQVNITNGAIAATGVVYVEDIKLANGQLSAAQNGETGGNITISGDLSGQGSVLAENTLTISKSDGLTTADGDDLRLEGKAVTFTGKLDSTTGTVTVVATENLISGGIVTLNNDVILANKWELGGNVTASGSSLQLVNQFTYEGATEDGSSSLNTIYTLKGNSLLVHADSAELDSYNEAMLGQLRNELDKRGYTGPAYLTDKTLNLTDTGKLVVGTTETDTTNDKVVFGDNSVLAVDGDISGAVFTAEGEKNTAHVSNSSKLYAENVKANTEITIFGKGFDTVNVGAEGWTNIQTDTAMLNGSYDSNGNKVTFNVQDAMTQFPGLSEDLAPAVNDLYNRSLNDVDSDYMGIRFLSRATNDNYLGRNDRAAAASTIESAARMAFAGAVPQMTKMASDAASNAVVNRLGFANPDNGAKSMNLDGKLVDDKALGLALWIAPLWSNQTGFGMEAGNLDYGYNANLGGISLGADYTWANNIRAGLMFNIGGGYAESAGGDLSETTNSMTFWGVGAYGGWEYNNFAVMADVSYTSTWNSVDQDVDHRMGMGDLEADIQASAISAGLRFEYKLETQYLDLIPHVGARYMSINTWGYDVETNGGTVLEGDGFQQNIWTFPVGITFSKELEMNNDWYFKPSVDFTVIPAAGDIKAKEDVRFTGLPYSTEIETQMMDYFTWQGGVGLEFGNDNMSVGVNYTLQAGQNSTGHGVFGMFRYEF